MFYGWKPGEPGGKPPGGQQTYNPSADFLLNSE